MSIVFRYDGALLPYQSVRLTGSQPGGVAGLPSSAWYGEAVFASVTIDDPTGTLNFNGHHTFTVEETLCSKPRIFTGWITARDVSRGPYVNGAGRVWDCEIIDQNWIFNLQTFRSTTDSVRPAETDVARVQSAITSSAMNSTPIYNNGRFSTSGPLSLSAANFVAQYPTDMIGSSAAQTGKNFYAYFDDATQHISLHYDLVGTGPAATISVSNVLSDVNNTTVFAPLVDATLTSDPSDLYTGVLLMTAAGNAYGQNQTVITSLSPSEFSPVTFQRDIVIRSDRISRAATRDAFLQKYLDIHSVEKVTLTFAVTLPAAKVNLARAGDVVNVRFSHLPGFTTSTAVAIIKRTVVPHADVDDYYDVHFECASFAAAKGPGGGGGGNLPPGNCSPVLVQQTSTVDTATNIVGSGMSFTTAPGIGHLMVMWVISRDVVATKLTPTGWTAIGTGWQDDPASGGGHKNIGCRFFYKFATASDTSVAFTSTSSDVCYVNISEWSGPTTFDTFSLWTNDEDVSITPTRVWGGSTVTPTAGRPTLILTGFMPSLNVNDSWHVQGLNGSVLLAASGVGDSGGSGGPAAKSALAYKAGPAAYGGAQVIQITQTDCSGIDRGRAILTLVFSATPCVSTPPRTAQPVTDLPILAPGDGSQIPAPTTSGYAAGTLFVFVDGVFQPVIELDPGAGTYQLYFTPRGTEVVIAKYQAA